MRRAVFLISLILSGAPVAARDPDAPPPYPFSAAEREALARALEDASEMPQQDRLLLRDALRRGISRGQLDRLTAEEKTAMMDAVYQAAGHDASRDGVDREERKRLLRDWVITFEELERAVYPQLTAQPNRYIVGRDVGAVGRDTPVQPAPSQPREQPQPPPQDAPQPGPTAPSAPSQPQDATPPVTPDMRPGERFSAGPQGWTPAPSAQEMASAAAGPAGPSGPADGGRRDLSKASAAVGKGAGAAAALADGTRSSAGAPAGPGGAGGGAPGRGEPPSPRPGAAAGPSGDPSAPATPADLALAAGPYRPAFEEAGLRVGRKDGAATVLRRDGAPASPGELSALSQTIASMPRAAMRDPSFLDPQAGISWERFQQLKAGLPGNAGREELKHIVLSKDGRDLERGESCAKVSGACNPLAEDSYKKGDDVPAKELDSIWSRIHDYLAKSETKDAGSRAARAALKSKGIWERVAAAFGLSGGSQARAARLAAAGALAGPSPSGAVLAEAPPGGLASAEGAEPSPREGAPPPRRRSFLLAALFAGGVVLAAVPLLRSRWLRDI